MPIWKKYKLGDITTVLGDGLHGTPKYSVNGDYYFINGNNLSNGKIIIKNETKKVSHAEFLRYKKDLTDRTIFVSINGTLGNYALYNNEQVMLGKSACYFNLKYDVDKRFVSQVISSKNFKEYLHTNATGTTIKNVSLKSMRDYEINLPPLPTQQHIAEILGALDDKIELNLQMNKTLEEMAMALYKHWFVDFGPFKDGEFVDSDLGLIPKGWEVKTIGEIVQLKYGKALKAVDRVPGQYPVYGSSGVVGTHESFIIDGPSIIIGRKGNVGATYWENRPSFPIDTVYYINSIPLRLLRFMYISFLNLDFSNRNSDSVVPGLNRNLAHSEKIIFPSEDIISSFEVIASGYYNQIFHNNIENETLIKTRDYLLPKLISGEVAVKLAEDEIKEML